MRSQLNDLVHGSMGTVDQAHVALNVHDEYISYVARLSEQQPDTQPMSFKAFEHALARWQQEYHDAWCRSDRTTMRALERLLAL